MSEAWGVSSALHGWRGLSRTWIHYFPSFFGHRVAQDCYRLGKCFRDIPAPLPRTVLPQRSVPAGLSRFALFSTSHHADQRAASFCPNTSCKRQRAEAGRAVVMPAQPRGDISGTSRCGCAQPCAPPAPRGQLTGDVLGFPRSAGWAQPSAPVGAAENGSFMFQIHL